jgi:hypothetical protein
LSRSAKSISKNLLRSLEAFEKVDRGSLCVTGNDHPLTLNDAQAVFDVALSLSELIVQCCHATFSRLEAGSLASRRVVAVRE